VNNDAEHGAQIPLQDPVFSYFRGIPQSGVDFLCGDSVLIFEKMPIFHSNSDGSVLYSHQEGSALQSSQLGHPSLFPSFFFSFPVWLCVPLMTGDH
jgi:hypothetical protein